MSGTFFVVSVGPGDPSLMTLKAVEVLRAVDVVAYPQTTGGSFAADIAAAHIGAADHVPFTVPMDGRAGAAYDAAAEAIDMHLEAGRSVALLCEGDAMLYGSAASITVRLPHRQPTIVPGVTAASACAAVAGVSLARGTAPFSIVPATAGEATLETALGQGGGVAVYKVGRHFDTVADIMTAKGRQAVLVSKAGLADQLIAPVDTVEAGPKPYFSTVIVAPSKGEG
ncbi:MAG: precorrin-2 C(20)-methyltransferase [Devosia sp.]